MNVAADTPPIMDHVPPPVGTVIDARIRSVLPGFMREHARPVLVTFIGVLVLALAIGLMISSQFVASADVWLNRGRSADGEVGSDRQAATRTRNTQIRLITSRDLAARTVSALGLDRVSNFGDSNDGWFWDKDVRPLDTVHAVQEGLQVSPIDNTNAVRLRFRASSAIVAASVVNRVADLYVAGGEGAIITTQLRRRLGDAVRERREAMVRGEAAAEAYRAAAGIVEGGGRYVEDRADFATIDSELAAARATARAKRAIAARAAAVRQSELRRRRTQQEVEDGTAGAAVDNEVPPLPRNDRNAAQADVAEARVQQLVRMRARMAQAAADNGRLAAELARLQAIAATARARHDQAVVAYSREAVADMGERSTAYVISRASAQNADEEPDRLVIVLFALGSAAMAAILVALALDYRQKGFRTAVALEQAVGARVLAMVPDLKEIRRSSSHEDRLAVPNYLVHDRNSPFAEIFRKLLFELRREMKPQESMVIAVSSALPDEGKTTVALCLARSAALNGERVVLVDCDVRRPAASRSLFRTLPIGLVEVSTREADLADALKRDPGSDAMILGVGSDHGDDVNALDIRAIGLLLKHLKRQFDVVVCDTPPALALTEAREIAALADAVLLVVRHRETPQDAVMIAQDLLRAKGTRIAGVVMTMVRS